MTQNVQKSLPDISYTYLLDAPIKKVWRAVATSEGLAGWLMPNDFQPVLGHAFTFTTQPVGDFDGIVRCKVVELDPPHHLGLSWNGNNMDLFLRLDLKELDGKTELSLVHSGWLESYAFTRNIMDEGWRRHTRERLESLLATMN
jgi:uncharacterized protein YndB with AHSA1/START domain